MPARKPLTPEALTANGHTVSYRVRWRFAGHFQSVTFSEQDYGRNAKGLAVRAAQLADAHDRQVTREQVYAAILKTDASGNAVITLNAFFDEWADQKLDVEQGTVSRYRSDWNAHMRGSIGKSVLTEDEVTAGAVQAWVNELQQTKVSRGGTKPERPGGLRGNAGLMKPRTVLKHHALLHQVLGAAVPQHLPVNPARDTRLPSLERGVIRDERVFLDHHEAELLLASFADDWARELTETMLETGLRFSETTALQGEDLVPADKKTGRPPRVKVQRAWKYRGTDWVLADPEPDDEERTLAKAFGLGAPKSVRSRREVPVDEHVFAMLSARANSDDPTDLLFKSPRGSRQREGSMRGGRRVDYNNFMRDRWRPAVARAQGKDPRTGVLLPAKERPKKPLTKKPTPHSCRHTYAKDCLEGGVTLPVLSARLGHDSSDFTWRTYGHLDPAAGGPVPQSRRARKSKANLTVVA